MVGGRGYARCRTAAHEDIQNGPIVLRKRNCSRVAVKAMRHSPILVPATFSNPVTFFSPAVYVVRPESQHQGRSVCTIQDLTPNITSADTLLWSSDVSYMPLPDRRGAPSVFTSVWPPSSHCIQKPFSSRQVKHIGSQYMPHPLNWKYKDIPMTKQDKVWGKVVRLRKTL